MKKNGIVAVVILFFNTGFVLAQKPPTYDDTVFLFPINKKLGKLEEKVYQKLDQDKKENYEKDKYVSFSSLNNHEKKIKEYYEGELKKMVDSLINIKKELKEIKLNETDQILAELKYSIISGLGFAQKPLSKEIVAELVPGIKEVTDDEDWEKFHKDNIPAWTAHELDGKRKLGVLLNVWAIKELMMKLSESEYWRLPEVEDLAKINGLLNSKGLTAFDALAADKAKIDVTPYKWNKPGKDYYEMGLLPGGYRKGNTHYPKTNQIKSCNFAITSNKLGLNFSEKLGISTLEENAKTIEYLIRDVKDAAWGLNVILFRKEK